MKPLMLIALLFLSACVPASTTPAPVQVQPVVEDTSISASARVVPQSYVSLAFANGGKQVDILVLPGETVKTGQILAHSDRQQLELSLAQARAGLRQAQIALAQLEKQPANETVKAAEAALVNAEYNVDRAIDRGALRLELAAAVAARDSAQANLDAIKAGPSAEQLDSARAAIDQAQVGVDLAELSLSQCDILSPIDGQVVEVYLRDAETASPGSPVFLVADLSKFKLETTDLSEVDAVRVSEGMPVKISFDAFPGQDIVGTISKIALKSAAGSGVNYTLEIVSDSFPIGIRWGMSAFVVITAP